MQTSSFTCGFSSENRNPDLEITGISSEDRIQDLGIDVEHLVRMRRYLHVNPELSGFEENTIRYIEEELLRLQIEYVVVEKGGIIARITGNGRHSPVVLLRADMDALPVQESPCNLVREKQVLSGTEKAAHVCGHDAHTAMLLSAAEVLNRKKDRFYGTILLCFERAEENGGPDHSYGYKPIFRYLEDHGIWPDTCFALHVRPGLESGLISAEPGGAYAGSFGFSIRILGSGGHGSRPDQTNHPLDCFTAFYQALQGLPMRTNSPFETFTFSIPVVRTGEAVNVIPDSLYFAGTARSYDMDLLNNFRTRFFECLHACCGMYGCTYEEVFSWMDEALINRKEDAFRLKEALEKSAPGCYRACEPSLGSETFARYTKKYGGALAFLGIDNKELGSGAPLHSPEFDLDEDALSLGTAAHVLFAMKTLGGMPA
ncbi:MAG: amidohydrolase [Lachnospiraceae bacterium]|nr:amidohydrolase [Lachnospiraceae bacterium]